MVALAVRDHGRAVIASRLTADVDDLRNFVRIKGLTELDKLRIVNVDGIMLDRKGSVGLGRKVPVGHLSLSVPDNQ